MKNSFLTRFVKFNGGVLLFLWFTVLIYRFVTWKFVYYNAVAEINGDDLSTSFYLGAKYDLRLIVFACIPILLMSLFFSKSFFNTSFWRKIVVGYIMFQTTVLNLCYAIDIGNYMYLKERVNASVLSFLTNPWISAQMMWESYPVFWIIFGLIGLTALQIITLRWWYMRVAPYEFTGSRGLKNSIAGVFLLVVAFSAYGKMSFYPLRWSEAFFSKNNDLSQLTLNPILYFVNSLKFSDTTFDKNETEKFYPTVARYLGIENNLPLDFKRSFTPLNDSIPEPTNVVVVMMESLGAQPLGIFNNPLSGSPFIDSLATNSWFLENFYVPRYGTARTVYASITGLPDVVETKTASRNPKAVDQRIILDQLKGFEKFYFLGGSANWANIRALFTNNISNIQIFEEGSYENEDRVDVWGINDGDLFRNADKKFKKLHDQKKPFIAYVQSSGYHPPYTVPDQEGAYKRLTTKDISEKEVQSAGFVNLDQYNALRYFDHNLRVMFDSAKKSGYYDNTVFVLFGDHNGRISPYNHMDKPEMETGLGQLHVPLIIHGKKIPKQRDKRMSNLIDVYPTIADILNQPYTNYTLGRSLLRRKKDDTSPTFSFEAYKGKWSPVMITPTHYYWSEKQGGKLSEIFRYNKESYNKPDGSFDLNHHKSLDSLCKGLYQSTLYLYFNNKK